MSVNNGVQDMGKLLAIFFFAAFALPAILEAHGLFDMIVKAVQ